MKKIFFFVFLSASFFTSIAQYNQPNNQIGTRNVITEVRGGFQSDQPPIIPSIDTLNNIATPYRGALTRRPQDSLLYMSDGVNWHAFLGGSPIRFQDSVFVRFPLGVDTTTYPGHQIIFIRTNNGLVSGGIVTKHDCWTVDVTAAIANMNYHQYVSLPTTLSIDSSDATLNRIDLIVIDTFGVVKVLKGMLSATPVAIVPNPSSQIGLAQVYIPAAASCLPITSTVVFDGIGDNAAQWDTAKAGTITANFSDITNPYHLVQDLFIQTYTDSSQIIFTHPSAGQDTVQASSTLVMPIYLNNRLSNQIQAQFFLNTTPVSARTVINNYTNTLDTGQYQVGAIPFGAFGFTSQIYNKIAITLAGYDTSGAGGFYLDWIRIQTGITQNTQNNFVDSTKIIDGFEYYYVKGIAYLAGAVGGGGSSITLKTNGVDNGSQSILNLKQGSNVTIADDGVGGVTISSSAPGTGTVTNVSSADANATVASPTTTPIITIVSAPKLQTGRTISITGDMAYTSPSFDGSSNVTAAGTLATVNSNVGTFGSATQVGQFTVNAKGLITSATNVTITPAASSITGGAALTKTDDTNVTLTLGGTPTTALLAAASITAGWTGTLAVTRGGTGLATTTAYGVIHGGTTATGAFQNSGTPGASGTVYTSTGTTSLPTWQTISGGGVGDSTYFWSRLGNVINPVTDYLGTKTNNDLRFKVNNTLVGYFDTLAAPRFVVTNTLATPSYAEINTSTTTVPFFGLNSSTSNGKIQLAPAVNLPNSVQAGYTLIDYGGNYAGLTVGQIGLGNGYLGIQGSSSSSGHAHIDLKPSTGNAYVTFFNNASNGAAIGMLNAATPFQIRAGATSGGGFTMTDGTLAMVATSVGSIGIGGITTVDASAIEELSSTTKGFLPPRMTTTQMSAISSPATGLELFNTTSGTNYAYNGSAYKSTGVISGSFSGVGTATTVFTVTFGGTQPNATYKVNVTPTAALSAALFYVTNKTTTTFDVTYLAGLTGTVTFDYSLYQ